jgi:hypothetical protein
MIGIYGASDDLVEIEGDVKDEVAPGKVIQVGDSTRGVRVVFKYAVGKGSGSVWRGSIEQIDEGVPMFPVTISEAEPSGYPNPTSYSVKFNIDCPVGTPVTVSGRLINRKPRR